MTMVLKSAKIPGSIAPLTNGSGSSSGSGSCYCRQWLSRSYIDIIFQRYKVIKESQNKTVGVKVFLTIYAWWQRDPDPDPYIVITDPDPGGPKTYGSATRYPKIRKEILHAFGGLYDSYLHDSSQRRPLHGTKNTKWSSFENGCFENYKMVSFNCTSSVLAKKFLL
jgi:hypothetical protein